MIVCVCRGVSERAVAAAIRAGARDVATLSGTTGAGTDCGCCRPALEALAAAAATPCAPAPCPGCPRARSPAGGA